MATATNSWPRSSGDYADDQTISEILLKAIQGSNSTMRIHAQNNSAKNKGYGTAAEILRWIMLSIINNLGMETVYADALKKHTRTWYVLEKVGFLEMRHGEAFCCYQCPKASQKSSA